MGPDTEESVQESEGLSTTSRPFAAPPSHLSSAASIMFEDESAPFPDTFRPDTEVPPFELALGLWCTDVGISRPQYSALLEVLKLLQNDKVDTLPTRVDTLKRRARGHLPLLELRKTSLSLAPEQQPSSRGGQSTALVTQPKEDLTFFNPIELFRRILSSNMFDKLHRGLAEFVDTPREMWQTDAWSTSIRTTCGEYAHIQETNEPIFPSDWVNYHNHFGGESIGRVVAVGRYYRSEDHRLEEGQIALKVFEAREAANIHPSLLSMLDPLLTDKELLLCTRPLYLPESVIIRRMVVKIDYDFQDPKCNNTEGTSMNDFLVRRTVDTWNMPEEAGDEGDELPLPTITPSYQIPPLRAELELRHYTRSHFVQQFDNKNVLSLPLLTFIDGFGLYRNAYRSIMGWYIIIAALTFEDRARRGNVHPLTLGPHGSNFGDVVRALRPYLVLLEGGVEVDILGEKIFLCAFTLSHIGDMPQQQTNAGMKTQRAAFGCRMCFVKDDERGNLLYDINQHGRYYWQNARMRQEMASKPTVNDKNQYASAHGLSVDTPPLSTVSPSLDLIRTTPPDPAHSELNGVAAESHRLLLDGILTEKGKVQYNAMTQRFIFPPGYPRIRSAITHLGSYTISEHSRWAIIIAPLLRVWLRKKHIRPDFWDAAKQKSNPLFTIVRAYAAQAKTCSLLMSPALTAIDRANLKGTIITSRRLYQDLLDLVATATTRNRRSRRATPALIRRSPTPSGLFAMDDITNASETAIYWIKDKSRPNVHTALHYPSLLGEYGTPCNLNVLIGEDKHRFFKKIIYQSNHRNPEQFLLERERLQLTLRLILGKGYESTDDERRVSDDLSLLSQDCPQLFKLLLPSPELADIVGEDEEDDFSIEAGEEHTNVSVNGRIKTDFVRAKWKLPTRVTMMSPEFRGAMRQAYQQYFAQSITHFQGFLAYYTKFGYTDRCESLPSLLVHIRLVYTN
jgi:hypothetical protein